MSEARVAHRVVLDARRAGRIGGEGGTGGRAVHAGRRAANEGSAKGEGPCKATAGKSGEGKADAAPLPLQVRGVGEGAIRLATIDVGKGTSATPPTESARASPRRRRA